MAEAPAAQGAPNRYRRGIAGRYGEEEQRRAAGCIGRPATGGDSFTDSESTPDGDHANVFASVNVPLFLPFPCLIRVKVPVMVSDVVSS